MRLLFQLWHAVAQALKPTQFLMSMQFLTFFRSGVYGLADGIGKQATKGDDGNLRCDAVTQV